MAIISGIHLLSREKVWKLVIQKWGIAFTEAVRSMDGGDYCTTCLVCFQFQWDCIIFNRHIISMKSQGFFQTPQDIMEECNGCSVLSTIATLASETKKRRATRGRSPRCSAVVCLLTNQRRSRSMRMGPSPSHSG